MTSLANRQRAVGALIIAGLAAAPPATAGDCTPEQAQQVIGPLTTSGDRFGAAIDARDGGLLVGAPLFNAGDFTIGRAFFYSITGSAGPGVVTFTTTFQQPNPASGDLFGASCAIGASIDGPLALIGAPGKSGNAGAAYLFNRNTGAHLFTLAAAPVQDAAKHGFSTAFGTRLGKSVAIVGAPNDFSGDGTGVVRVYSSLTGALQLTLDTKPEGSFQQFGHSVAASGNIVAIGAPDEGAGHVYLFNLDNGDLLADIFPTKFCSEGPLRFGESVTIDGGLLVVGAPKECSLGLAAGAAWAYDISNPKAPVELDKFTAFDGDGFEEFGISVRLEGTRVVVGAWREQNPDLPGSAYVFEIFDGEVVPIVQLDASEVNGGPPVNGGNDFGGAVAQEDGIIFIGAPGALSPQKSETGAVYAFTEGGVTYWDAPAGGSFAAPANWSAGTPGPCDAALFDDFEGPVPLNPAYTVTLFAGATVEHLGIHTDQVAFNLSGNQLVLGEGDGGPSPALAVGEHSVLQVGSVVGAKFFGSGQGFGGEVLVDGDVAVARPDSFATLVLEGSSTQMTVLGSMDIGAAGVGILDIKAGANLSMPPVGAGSRDVLIGGSGVGAMTLSNAFFELELGPLGEMVIGADAGGGGVLSAFNGSLLLSGGGLIIGDAGNGSVALEGDTATQFFIPEITLADDPGSQGELLLGDDATIVAPTTAIRAGLGAAEITFRGSPTLAVQSLESSETTEFRGSGSLVLTGVDPLRNFGIVQPELNPKGALAPGVLSITGTYQQKGEPSGGGPVDSGTLRVVVDGDTPPKVSRLAVNGPALLGGQLTVLFDATPPLLDTGDSMPIVTATTFLGTRFDAALFPPLAGGKFLTLSYNDPQASQEGSTDGGGSSVAVVVEDLDGDVGFEDPLVFQGGALPTGAVLADFGTSTSSTPDTFLDLAISLPDLNNPGTTPGVVLILYNAGVDGAGEWLGFEANVQVVIGIDPRGLDAGDIDGDGAMDIAVALAGQDAVGVLLNAPGGLITGDVFTFPAAGAVVAVTLADLNGDVLLDAAAVSPETSIIDIYLNAPPAEGGGAWGGFEEDEDVELPAGSEPEDVTHADFDNDGDEDLATANAGDDSIGVVENNGGEGEGWNGFGDPDTIGLVGGSDPGSVQPGDLDNDKDIDLVSGDRGRGTVSVIVNGSSGTTGASGIILTPSAPLEVNPAPSSVELVDLGEDPSGSDLDIAVAVEDPSTGNRVVQILRNDSLGQQIAFTDVAIITPAADALFVRGGDLDNDGVNDIVSIDQTASATSLASVGPSGVSVFLGDPIDLSNQCPGDVSGDGVVNSQDLNIVLSGFGCAGGAACAGDTDGDGDTDSLDLNTVLAAFGDACPCSEDTNNDGVVNSIDLNAVLGSFGCTDGCGAGDIDADGDVDSVDLNLVLALFGQECG